MRFLKTAASLLILILLWGPKSTHAESITAANDGIGTAVTSTDGQYDIGGGTLVDTNLFHSFEQLGLTQGEIANFLSNPDIENILGRVVGGDASVINGLVQVTGSDANLFLLNPAGILFGPDSQLNLGGDFTATAATGIQLDEGWFSSVGDSDLNTLGGDPRGFVFATEQAGSVLNAGNLNAQRIVLLGGTVINTGTLSAPGGDITIEAVPGESIVAITQAGSLLSLGLPISEQSGIGNGTMPLTPLTLPQLLSNQAGLGETLGVVVDGDQVRLTRSNTAIPTEAGVAIASGILDVSSATAGASGGRIDVLGEQVALVDVDINASGDGGGGDIRVGGGYQGNDSVQNAQSTYVGREAAIAADATITGNGGQVVVWAEGTTHYYGDISAQGGSISGNGGFVEVSGKQSLDFNGVVNTLAANGETGSLLLDPTDITIISADVDGGFTDLSEVRDRNALDSPTNNTISARLINEADSNVVLSAFQDITFDAPVAITTPGIGLEANASRNITINHNVSTDNGDVKFVAGASFRMDPNNAVTEVGTDNSNIRVIETTGGDIDIQAADITAGGLSSESTNRELSNITLEATEGDIYVRYISLSGNALSDNELKLPGGPPRGNITITARNGIFQATGVISDDVTSDDSAVSILSSAFLNGEEDNRPRSGNIEISAQSSGELGIGSQLVFDPPSQIVDVIRAAVVEAELENEDAYEDGEPDPEEEISAANPPAGINALLVRIEEDDSLNRLVETPPGQTGGSVLPNVFSEISQSIKNGLTLNDETLDDGSMTTGIETLRQSVVALVEISNDLKSDPSSEFSGSGSPNIMLIEDFVLAEGQSGLRGSILRRNFNGQSDSGGTNGSSLGEGIAFNSLDIELDAPPNVVETREEEENQCGIEKRDEEGEFCQQEVNSESLLTVEAVILPESE